MSFRDFIVSRLFRRRLEDEWERRQNIKPPVNPSRRYIDKLVRRLLDEDEADCARRELEMIGAAAVPFLAAALADERFRQVEWPDSLDNSPFDSVLELLVPHGAEYVLAASLPSVDSPNHRVCKIAGLALASIGRVEAIPALARLLQDIDGDVRAYVSIGLERAVSAGRADEEFRR